MVADSNLLFRKGGEGQRGKRGGRHRTCRPFDSGRALGRGRGPGKSRASLSEEYYEADKKGWEKECKDLPENSGGTEKICGRRKEGMINPISRKGRKSSETRRVLTGLQWWGCGS